MSNTTMPEVNLTNGNETINNEPPCEKIFNINDAIGFTVGYAVMFIVAFVGNSIIIHIIRCHGNMRNLAFNWLIVNMAAADIITALVAIPLNVEFLYVGRGWFPGLFGTITCKLLNFVQALSVGISVLTLTVISIDRYQATSTSMKNQPLSSTKVKVAIVLIWLLAAAAFALELFKFTVTDDASCMPDWKTWSTEQDEISSLIRFILIYILPLIVMTVFYSIIIYRIRRWSLPGETSQGIQKRRERQKKRSVYMLLTILTVFTLCWIPIQTLHFLYTYRRELVICVGEIWIMLCVMIGNLNCAINPLIYVIFIKNFQDGLREIFNLN